MKTGRDFHSVSFAAGTRRSGGVGEVVPYESLQTPCGRRKPRHLPRHPNTEAAFYRKLRMATAGDRVNQSSFPSAFALSPQICGDQAQIVQTFAFLHFHYKEFYRPLSIDMFPILRRVFWPFSQLLWTLYKFIVQIFIICRLTSVLLSDTFSYPSPGAPHSAARYSEV